MTDGEHDVIVLGAGPAGLAAAVTAARMGRSVCVVEATSELGGNAPFATGNLALSGTRLQSEQGVDDPPARFVDDMLTELDHQRSAYDPVFDRELAELYATEGGASFDFLAELGFVFRQLVPRPKQHRVDRLSALVDPGGFRELLPEALRAAGGELRVRSRASRLLTRGDHRVVGVVVTDGRGETELRARAVVVATGGYAGSPELRQRYRPDQDPESSYPGIPSARGDGHRLIEQAGGDLVNMHMIVPIIRANARVLQETIAINDDGLRFHDETGHHDERIAALRAQPGGIGYYLCDARIAQRDARFLRDIPSPARQFGSLADVARGIGCALGTLEGTVKSWNAAVAGGAEVDPAFGRMVFPQPRLGIEQPPFTVVPIVCGVASTIGGARVDRAMRVLDRERTAIAGLHAAGDVIGLINPVAALGGIHLSSAVTTGRLAGAGAARGCIEDVGQIA